MTDKESTITAMCKMTSPTCLELIRTLPATPTRVWKYLVESELREKWIASGKTDIFVGGKIHFHFDHTKISNNPPPPQYADENIMDLYGEILTYDPPHVLKFYWPEAHARDSVVTITLTEKGSDTILHLIHERLDNPDIHLGILAGWHAHTDLLEDILLGRQAQDFWLRDQELEAFYRQEMNSS